MEFLDNTTLIVVNMPALTCSAIHVFNYFKYKKGWLPKDCLNLSRDRVVHTYLFCGFMLALMVWFTKDHISIAIRDLYVEKYSHDYRYRLPSEEKEVLEEFMFHLALKVGLIPFFISVVLIFTQTEAEKKIQSNNSIS